MQDPEFSEFVNDLGHISPSEQQNPKEHPFHLVFEFEGEPIDTRCFVFEIFLMV